MMAALEGLESALADVGVEAELMVIDGVVMSLVFAARPKTRRASALFRERRLLRDAAEGIEREHGLAPDWLSTASRQLVAQEGALGGGRDGPHLRVFSPTPDYVLAMKCAELGAATGDDRKQVETDLRHLLRLTGVEGVPEVLERVATYFSARQLPDDLPERLGELFQTVAAEPS